MLQVVPTHNASSARRGELTVFGEPARTLGWKLGLVVVLIAAVTAGAVAYLATGDTDPGTASPGGETTETQPPTELLPMQDWMRSFPPSCGRTASSRPWPSPRRRKTAVCLPQSGNPIAGDLGYPDSATLAAAYEGELRRRDDIERDKGRSNAFSWGGERQWMHGPDKPGGRTFCYFDGDDAVIVWTHQRLGQATHRAFSRSPARAAATTPG